MERISYLVFRQRALQGLTLKGAMKGMEGMSKDDLEKWVMKEYKRHYGKKKKLKSPLKKTEPKTPK